MQTNLFCFMYGGLVRTSGWLGHPNDMLRESIKKWIEHFLFLNEEDRRVENILTEVNLMNNSLWKSVPPVQEDYIMSLSVEIPLVGLDVLEQIKQKRASATGANTKVSRLWGLLLLGRSQSTCPISLAMIFGLVSHRLLSPSLSLMSTQQKSRSFCFLRSHSNSFQVHAGSWGANHVIGTKNDERQIILIT